ncbi:hypothetical protein K438DRAFT_1176759 [Mycena galopus ATCC 62051]|nr:hypothetical protein K438DRAFT_1176759 [Mycena galopus ATCC 62051]
MKIERLIALSRGQDTLDTKIQAVLDQNIRSTLEKWLQPANVALSQRDAANKRHAETGLWLFQRVEFKEWIYASNSLMWLHGISGSGKTVLSSTIINALRARAEPLAFFYFDTNNRKQLTVTQLLYSLVDQLSVQAHPPDKTLNSLWTAYANGKHLPSNAALISDALIPILRQLTKPVYIVLDALDECSERDELLRVITLLVDAKLLHVHILMTSRPEVTYGVGNGLSRVALDSPLSVVFTAHPRSHSYRPVYLPWTLSFMLALSPIALCTPVRFC